jgi:hypothetical protein
MPARTIDLAASSITIRTRAKGLLSKLAHDLEIQADHFEGSVELDGDAWRAELAIPVSGLRVVGALKNDSVDHGVLSARDVADIARKIQREVLVGREIRVTVEGASRVRGRATVVAPGGRQTIDVDLDSRDEAGFIVASGLTALSLSALGVKEIKGPLGAFKVDDRVEVAFCVRVS